MGRFVKGDRVFVPDRESWGTVERVSADQVKVFVDSTATFFTWHESSLSWSNDAEAERIRRRGFAA